MDLKNVEGLVCQVSDMVDAGKITREDAIALVSNLVDLDKDEPETEIERFIYQWIDEF